MLVPLLALCASADAGPVGIGPRHIRDEIESAQDRLTARCARDNPVPRTVTLDIKGRRTTIELDVASPKQSDEPAITITTTSTDAFSQCFAREAAQTARSTAYIKQGFGISATLTLTPPDRLLTRVLNTWLAGDEATCRPSAGPIPTSIAIDITSDDLEMTVKVTLEPANAALEACALSSLNATLLDAHIDTGRWKPTAHIKRKLTPIVTNASLRESTAYYGPQAIASCIPSDIAAPIDEAVAYGKKPARLGTMTVSARATRDGDIAVAARSRDKTRDACTSDALTTLLHEHYERRFGDGTTFFRLDGNAAATMQLPIETPRPARRP